MIIASHLIHGKSPISFNLENACPSSVGLALNWILQDFTASALIQPKFIVKRMPNAYRFQFGQRSLIMAVGWGTFHQITWIIVFFVPMDVPTAPLKALIIVLSAIKENTLTMWTKNVRFVLKAARVVWEHSYVPPALAGIIFTNQSECRLAWILVLEELTCNTLRVKFLNA